MQKGKTPISYILWIVVLTLIFIGLQSQTQKLPARAEDSPGFGLLEDAKKLRLEKKYKKGFDKALEISRLARNNKEWNLFGECFKEAFQCALKSNTNSLYPELLKSLLEASEAIAGNDEISKETNIAIWKHIGTVQHFLGNYEEAAEAYETTL